MRSKATAPKKKSSRATNVILVIILVVGLGIMLYPSVSDLWNQYFQSRAIMEYAAAVTALNDDEFAALWDAADAYNQALYTSYSRGETAPDNYNEVLNLDGGGMMSYIDIPSINCHLAVFHGTDDATLQNAVGHLESSSLPVGGESTHCVLSGHRGLPSARLFTDLDLLQEGDIFTLETLGITLTYEIDQIRIVLPTDQSELQIVPGEDYCTLVTCTPYGVNSHRLLVRGHRIVTSEETTVQIPTEALLISSTIMMFGVGIPMLMLFLIALLIRYRRRPPEPTREELFQKLAAEAETENAENQEKRRRP